MQNESSTSRPRVFISVNIAWNIVNFRMGLVRALVNAGYDVFVLAERDETLDELRGLPVRFVRMSIYSRSMNPIRDLRLFAQYVLLFGRNRHRAAAYLGFTVKPNVYGSLAAQLWGIPVINNVAGLGALFNGSAVTGFLARRLYQIALFRSKRVFFQNTFDRALFLERGLVRSRQSALLPGSGIDLVRFRAREYGGKSPAIGYRNAGETRFLMITRLLWDKGVGEFADAARFVTARHPQVRFILAGFVESRHRAAVPSATIEQWEAEGILKFIGRVHDVRPVIEDADCVVLPTAYREGTPRVLLEAAAMSRPIITTDIAGARDVVQDGRSGYLCRPRDFRDLAEKVERFLSLPEPERRAMGEAGRKHVETHYDENVVIEAYRRELAALAQARHLTTPQW
ncbi:MAG: glycosyltransferase family 4 protein [Spirochaetales bacterium]